MKRSAAALLALGFSALPARADWLLDGGVAIVSPSGGNSTIELLAVHCGDPYHVEVLSRGGPVRPDGDAGAAADYFYQPGKVQARIDGQAFPLVAAGSDAAVVLFAQGTPAQNHMAPVGRPFIAALKAGTMLTLAFDITPQANPDGTAHETVAQFPLAGSGAVLDAALKDCG